MKHAIGKVTTATSNSERQMFFQSARAEIVQRLALRDQSLIAYIVAAGAYLGFVVQPQLKPASDPKEIVIGMAILIVLPILSLLFTYVILQHHIIIGRLGEYIRSLYPDNPDCWECFYPVWKDRTYLTARTISQALLLIMPTGYTTIFVLEDFELITSKLMYAAIVSAMGLIDTSVVVVIIFLHINAYRKRLQTDYKAPQQLG